MQNIPWEEMARAAKEVHARAHAPYSKLQVGAAVWTGSRLHAGCNIENASFGLTVCAERHALAHAVAQGERPKALLVLAPTPKPIVPCGACRQVLLELCAEDLPILCCTLSGEQALFRLSELLPFAFERGLLP
jgi:cytidine deaminase